MEEPMVKAHIIRLQRIRRARSWNFARNSRGVLRDMKYIEANRVNILYELPAQRDHLRLFRRSSSPAARGYASFDYELKEYVQSDLVKLDYPA